jgi:hypothetical protein
MRKTFDEVKVGDFSVVYKEDGGIMSVGSIISTDTVSDSQHPMIKRKIITIDWEINEGRLFSYIKTQTESYEFYDSEKDILALNLKLS